MYVRRPRLLLGIGALFLPLAVAISGVQWLLWRAIDLLGALTGQGAGTFAYLAVVVGTALALTGLALVQAATTCALVELDAGRRVTAVHAYRLALGRYRPLFGGIAIFVGAWVVLSSTLVLLPFAIWLAIRWSLLAPVVEMEGHRHGAGALHRSGRLVRGRWFRVGSLVGVSAVVALLTGPLLGAALIFVSNSSLALLNVVAGVVYALTLPFVALVTAYTYFDARTRVELDEVASPTELPAQIELGRPT
jgi:hypothetical protein